MAGTGPVLVMGLDVSNGLFGNFHVNWAGVRWFSSWCAEQGLPQPFIGWESGLNNGDECDFDRSETHIRLATEWCEALAEKSPEIAKLGTSLPENPPENLNGYLFPRKGEGAKDALSVEEWNRRAVAAWYAILRHGVEHGGILEYW